MKPIIKFTAAIAIALGLGACVNDGTVADKHPITFEKPLPAMHPSSSEISSAVVNWQQANFYEASAILGSTFGPVRYAALIIPSPKKDFFVCARFTAKNQYGTYTPPQSWLLLLRDYGQGLSVGLAKQPGSGQYDQYCVSQDHG